MPEFIAVSLAGTALGDGSGPCHSFDYVPGAGDDEESWARGLTPEAFWSNRDVSTPSKTLVFDDKTPADRPVQKVAAGQMTTRKYHTRAGMAAAC